MCHARLAPAGTLICGEPGGTDAGVETCFVIDRSSIQGIDTDPEDAGIIQAVIALAARLGGLGGDPAHGHLLFHPLASDDLPSPIDQPQ